MSFTLVGHINLMATTPSIETTMDDAVKGLTSWEPMAKFVAAFGNPWAADVAIGLIVLGLVLIIWICGSTILAWKRSSDHTDIELAKLGIVRPRSSTFGRSHKR